MKKKKSIKNDFKSLRTNKQFLTILILLFISAFFWIFISLIGSQSKEKISKELTILAKPLVPTIDKDTLSKIEGKYSYSEEELSSFIIYKILTSRNGKTEKIVPLSVTIDDIEPESTPVPKEKQVGFATTLLQDEIDTENDEESSEAGDLN